MSTTQRQPGTEERRNKIVGMQNNKQPKIKYEFPCVMCRRWTDLLSEPIPQDIQIFGSKKRLSAPVLDPFFVLLWIMQGKYGLHILPFSLSRGDVGTALGLRSGD